MSLLVTLPNPSINHELVYEILNPNVVLSVGAELRGFPWAHSFFYLVLTRHRRLRWFKTNGPRGRSSNQP